MAVNRRKFISNLAGAAGTVALLPLAKQLFARKAPTSLGEIERLTPGAPGAGEDFWNWIRHAYTESPTIFNLNNGGVSPQPKVVQEAFVMYNRLCNEAPSYYMWRVLDKGRESLRGQLAELSGCSPEELAIDRNTTESLDTIIAGLRLKKGDEVVMCHYDYPNMRQAWEQRAKREGIVLKYIDLALPADDDEAIVKAYTDRFTSKTRIAHITHIINYTGQIMPARKIADAAHAKGIDVVIDGAHSYAHLDYKIPDLGGDYFGTSLHKWLCAPFGTGMLYVKKDKIAGLWTSFPNPDPESGDIRKFENLGTRSFPAEEAIGHAIDFHKMIGAKRKEERLRYLTHYWVERVQGVKGFKLFTSMKPQYSCALATFGMEGKEGGEISSYLFKKHQIHTTSIKYKDVNGVRVTPHVYTSTDVLDRLVKAIKEYAAG